MDLIKEPHYHSFFFLKSRLPYQVEKNEVGMPEVGVSEEGFAARRFPVTFQN